VFGTGEPVLPRYERIAFEKALITPPGQPPAAFVCPGHPLLDATLGLLLEQHGDLLRRGTVLVDECDAGTDPRILVMLEHTIQDANMDARGTRRTVSQQMLTVECRADGQMSSVQYAPYLDYRPLEAGELDIATLLAHPACQWIGRDLEQQVLGHAIATIVPRHVQEVKHRRLEVIAKTRAAVQDRLSKEIAYWDHRAEDLKLQEQAGKPNARLNSQEARRRADDLQSRLQKRMEQLDREAQLSPLPPVVIGGLAVVPVGLISAITGRPLPPTTHPTATQESAARARAIVMAIERGLGFEPVDREFERLGYDIESRDPATGKLRFIEVKGRVAGARTITVTRNEILVSLNKPEDYLLALVQFQEDGSHHVAYLRQPFEREPDFAVVSQTYEVAELLARASEPV
jgi:hypothetical protein